MSESGDKRGQSWLSSFVSKLTGGGSATKRLMVLSESMSADDADRVCALIDKGANVDEKNTYGATPLLMASQNGHKDVIQLLLQANADINAARTTDGVTPLFMASSKGHTEVVQLLLVVKADVNATDTNGRIPLLMAVGNGHTEVVQLLLEAEADVNAKVLVDGESYTPLGAAKMHGHERIVGLLREHGATE